MRAINVEEIEIATVSRSESPAEWRRTANARQGVAVRSRSQQSLPAASNVSSSRSLSGIDHQLFGLLTLNQTAPNSARFTITSHEWSLVLNS